MRRAWPAQGWALLASLAATTAGATALAGQDPADAAFDRGLADMEAGRYDTACAALADSYRLDPKPGALYTQATCEARWGKVATAIAHYDAFLAVVSALPAQQQQKHRERVQEATAQRATLLARVPRLALVAPAPLPEGVVVTLDGEPVEASRLGVEIPVDAGEHRIKTGPAGAAREQLVTVRPGESARVILPAALVPAGPAPPTRRSPWLTAGYAAIGLGAAGVLAGALAGALAAGKKATVDQHCTGPSCDPTGKAAADSGEALALGSTVGFVMGLGVAAGGVVLVLTAPKAPSPAVTRPSGAMLSMTLEL